eukprot:207207_1
MKMLVIFHQCHQCLQLNNMKFNIMDIVAHHTNMNDNDNNINGRPRDMSKSSTYSQVAAQKLISIDRIESNIKNAVKLADPQFQNELQLNTIINTNDIIIPSYDINLKQEEKGTKE